MDDIFKIDNFLNNKELHIILSVFEKYFKKQGFVFLDSYYQINNPLLFSEIHDFLYKKIKNLIGNFYQYSEIQKLGKISHNCDFILKQYKIFMPHTDHVPTIPGFYHYRDLIFPLLVDKKKETFYYICNQIYEGKACHLQFGAKSNNDYKPIYAQIFNKKPYEDYGIKNINYKNQVSKNWIDEFIGSDIPSDFFKGLSIKKMFKWEPGSLIIQSPVYIHGPTNYHLRGADWKIGMTIRVFKKNEL